MYLHSRMCARSPCWEAPRSDDRAYLEIHTPRFDCRATVCYKNNIYLCLLHLNEIQPMRFSPPQPCLTVCLFAVLFSLLATIAAGKAAAAEDGAQPAGSQQAKRLDARIPVQLDYLLYLPKDYESKPSWPLLLFLHGAGERGDNLDRVKIHGPPKLIAAGKDFPFIVVSPQCPKDRWWEPFELTALLNDVIASHKVDQDRVYVSGLSMGGFGTWALAAHSPRRFAALAPICGGGGTRWARRFAQVPIWVFHGGKDRAVPVERSEEMVAALKQAKGEPRFTLYPDAGHDSWTETYDNPEFYKWLLEQRRAESD